jgi:hypothetical protein
MTDTLTRRFYLTAIAILLLAAALRLTAIPYGSDDPCLLPAAEHWLYERPQPISLYTWDIPAEVYQLEHGFDPLERAIAPDGDALIRWRLLGLVPGLLTVALTLWIGRLARVNWWWLAGLFVAAAPWFVQADMWVVRYDPAVLVVALSVALLLLGKRLPDNSRWAVPVAWAQQAAAISLIWIAPPLFWLAGAMVLLQPRHDWKAVILFAGSFLVIIPALAAPLSVLRGITAWDTGATAACVLAGLFAAMLYWRELSRPILALAGIGVFACGAVTITMLATLPHPTPAERAVITFLHERVPDHSVVQFDNALVGLMPVTECPHGTPAILHPQPEPVVLSFAPIVGRSQPDPAFVVTRQRVDVADAAYVHEFEEGLLVGRMIAVPQATDIGFGDRFFVVGWDVLTPEAAAGSTVDVRLDYQYAAHTDNDSLGYNLFIHVTPADDPGALLVNYNASFTLESGNFGPREFVLNQHHRFALPADTAPGTYDVRLGIYNVMTGERLRYWGGDILTLGQIQVP